MPFNFREVNFTGSQLTLPVEYFAARIAFVMHRRLTGRQQMSLDTASLLWRQGATAWEGALKRLRGSGKGDGCEGDGISSCYVAHNYIRAAKVSRQFRWVPLSQQAKEEQLLWDPDTGRRL